MQSKETIVKSTITADKANNTSKYLGAIASVSKVIVKKFSSTILESFW